VFRAAHSRMSLFKYRRSSVDGMSLVGACRRSITCRTGRQQENAWDQEYADSLV